MMGFDSTYHGTKTMTEPSISAYDKFITDSAEQYLQTVVLIDDRIYENKSGSVASSLTKPPAIQRKAALKSATSLSDKRGKKFDKAKIPEEPGEISFHEVQNSFAKNSIICSLYQPKKNASFGEQSEVYKLCSPADVVIVDWDLDDPSGDKATTLVGSLIEQSRVEIPCQLRLVLIYTLDPNLQSVTAKIYDDLVRRLGEHDVAVEPDSEGLVLTTENARVVVLGKRENTSLTQFKDHWVPESKLAPRTIREFSRLASGLLQGIVLRGIANLRKNNRRILTRFHKDLDIAFLTHRALLLPDGAFDHIVPLLTDELHAVLDDTLGESPLGKASIVKEILDGWCDKHWQAKDDVELKIGDGVNSLEFVKDVFSNGPALKNNYSGVQGSQIPGLIKEGNNNSSQWREKNCQKLAEYLLGSCKVSDCHEKFGSLMSQRVKYDDSRRTLHLGVIVKEIAGGKRYLLCLQPVCDSLRIEGKKQSFLFCVLEAPQNNESFTHCVIDVGGKIIRLRYKPKVANIFVKGFKGTPNAVFAIKENEDRFVFKADGKEGYEWIAELKTEHAQRAAEQFGGELSRVGLTESEWLRIKAK